MTKDELRALLRSRGHTSFSAASEIGCSADQLRHWTSGKRPIPEKYFPAIEKLSTRSQSGKRWSPAAAGIPKASIGKRRTKAEKREARQARETARNTVDPLTIEAKQPWVDVEADAAEAPASGGIIGVLVKVFEPLSRLARGDYLEDGLPGPAPVSPCRSTGQAPHGAGLDGETINLPAVIPQGQASRIALPIGASLPGAWTLYADVFPGVLFGRACAMPAMTRLDGGQLAPSFCGCPVAQLGDVYCPAHSRVDMSRLRPQPARPIGPVALKVRPRQPAYG